MDDPLIPASKSHLPGVAFAVLATGIVAAGWLYQRQQQRQVDARAESQLRVVADLKVGQIMAWRAERMQDARDLASNPFLAQALEQRRRSSSGLARDLRPWLRYLSSFHEYTDTAFLDSRGRPVVAQHEWLFPLRAQAWAHVTAALASSGPLLSDLVREAGSDEIHLDLAVAVQRGGQPGAPVIGAILYRLDPGYQLFQLLQSWPTASPSAETLLVRRDGDQVLFLNELRHRQGTALSLRLPLTATQIPAVQAALGREGLFRGVDDRGVPVVAALRRVPGTAWTLIAKVDEAEALAPARESTRAAVAAVLALLALLAAVAVGLALWGRQERAAFLAQKSRHELDRQQLLRRAEEALVASEERLRLTLDSIGDAVIATDAEGRVERMNPIAERLTGWRLEECRGWPLGEVFRIVNEDTHRPVESPAAQVLREGRMVQLANHTLLISRDGSQRPIADSGAPIRDPEGRIEGVVMVFRDASVERARRALAGFQTRLLETLHDAVIGLDSDQRVRTWNSAAEQLYGWTASEAIGRDSPELLGTEFPGGAAGRAEVIRLPLENGRVHVELPQRRRDGTRILAEIDAAELRRSDGALDGYLLVARDVTDRRRTEEALRASEAKFRAAFHCATLGILLLDAEGRLLEYNRAFREMLGYSDAEMQELRASDLLHADDLPRSRQHLREMEQGSRDGVVDERRFRRKGGGYAQGLLRSSPVRGPTGELLYVVGVVEDVTQRRVMEAQLVFADRMSAIGTLAAGVAHEVNNPLAFIIANVTYALDELAKDAPALPDITHALREARDGAERARDIVRDLKIFSHPDGEHHGDAVDVRDALRSSINLAQNEIRHRARLIQDLRDVPPVTASTHRLGQVFLNLLVNAVQALPEGQALQNEIRVGTRRGGDGRVMVEVADSGSGIAPDHLPRIFEPFFTTKPVGVGTGLGLSICHGIITGLGGEIEVQSTPGKGSTFRVLLPAAPATATPTPTAPPATLTVQPPASTATRGRILVVDDEPLVVRAIHRILSPSHEVVCLTSARTALARIEEDSGFDLVLCDLMMPEMTGMELHQRLAETRPPLGERMVFLSGGAFTPQAREFLDQIPNPRLEKPFDPRALRALVNDLLHQWRS